MREIFENPAALAAIRNSHNEMRCLKYNRRNEERERTYAAAMLSFPVVIPEEYANAYRDAAMDNAYDIWQNMKKAASLSPYRPYGQVPSIVRTAMPVAVPVVVGHSSSASSRRAVHIYRPMPEPYMIKDTPSQRPVHAHHSQPVPVVVKPSQTSSRFKPDIRKF